jgi:hypothetical protein
MATENTTTLTTITMMMMVMMMMEDEMYNVLKVVRWLREHQAKHNTHKHNRVTTTATYLR